MNEPHWLMSPDGKLVGVQCGDEKIMRTGTFEAFCEAAVYFLMTKLPRENFEQERKAGLDELLRLSEELDLP